MAHRQQRCWAQPLKIRVNVAGLVPGHWGEDKECQLLATPADKMALKNPIMSEETAEPGRAGTACSRRLQIEKTDGV